MPVVRSVAPIGADFEFAIHTIPALRADPSLLPTGPGLYVALFPCGIELLDEWGYFDLDPRPPLMIAGHPTLYVGMTSILGLRHRVDNHVRGDSRVSTLRMTLGALLRTRLALKAIPTPRRAHFHFEAPGEERLSDWMAHNVLVGVRACEDPILDEKRIIQNAVVPLNISDRRAHAFSRKLMGIRRQMTVPAGVGRVELGPWRTEQDAMEVHPGNLVA